MGKDEQLQIKKDTLWEIHEKTQEIACLEKMLSNYFDAMLQIRKSWDSKTLGVLEDHSQPGKLSLVIRTGEGHPPASLPRLPVPDDFSQAVHELDQARKQLASLEDTFNRM